MTRQIITKMVVWGPMLAMAMPAAAGDFGLQLGVNVGSRHGQQVGVNLAIGQQRSVVPVQRVWIQPVYKVVTERVWVPTVQTAYRDIPVVGPYGQVVSYRREPYTIRSGCWKNVRRQVPVRQGHYSGTSCTTAPQRRYPVIGSGVRQSISNVRGAAYVQPTQRQPQRNFMAPTRNSGRPAAAVRNQSRNGRRTQNRR